MGGWSGSLGYPADCQRSGQHSGSGRCHRRDLVMEDRRQQTERRSLNPDQRAIYLELKELSHKTGARSGGQQWTAVPRNLLITAVELIEQLRKID